MVFSILMGRIPQLQLRALVTSFDRLWVPQLEQTNLLIKGLSHICNLEEPANLPKKGFAFRPCPRPEVEDLDEDVLNEGIDVFGKYHPTKSLITLCMCRMRRFATRHGFQFEDVITIVLIHELAHFVTHRGKSNRSDCWEDFEKATPEVIENMAQQATHLYLRVAGYGRLVQVFDSLSNHCPDKYKTWWGEWKRQIKIQGSNPRNSSNYLHAVLEAFQNDLAAKRKEHARQREDMLDHDE